MPARPKRLHSRSLDALFFFPFCAYGIGTALVTSVLKDPEQLVGQRPLFVEERCCSC